MSLIIQNLHPDIIRKTAQRCRRRGILIPTFKQLRHPESIPDSITSKLKGVGLSDVNPVNLFRITWKNDLQSGLFGEVNYLEIPRAITGVKPRIIGLTGKHFPTGAHKVGAAFGCLVPRLVSGEFDPEVHKAAWPSTGNYCRGGAFDCALLDCTAIAILPKGMSRERFDWLKQIGAQIIATPGCESNVKEIYDKCWELKKDPLNFIFNQFEEFGNPIFHYNVTGPAIEEVFLKLQHVAAPGTPQVPLSSGRGVGVRGNLSSGFAGSPVPVSSGSPNGPHPRTGTMNPLNAVGSSLSSSGGEGRGEEAVFPISTARFMERGVGVRGNWPLRAAAYISATGSAGTIAAGDFLKKQFPGLKVVATEALQCPTLLLNGFGDHRIEGIGDKHVPWVHNVRNTDAVAAIDDEDCLRVLRLFNEPAGREYLASLGAGKEQIANLSCLGISGICNLLAAIKTAKYFELDEQDVIFTVFTDSTDLYQSRLQELQAERGPYRPLDAAKDHAGPIAHQRADAFKDLTYLDRKAIHNLKYYTWVEQQGKTAAELTAQWDPEYWRTRFEDEVLYFDELIDSFNKEAAG